MVKSELSHVNIQIGGNIDGSIVIGENNFVVNTNHGTIVYKQAALQVRARGFVAQPPRAPRGFLNRAAELQKLASWISANEMVLIHAPDGMGKSALLKQAANTQAGRAREHGVIFMQAATANAEFLGPDDIIQSLFDALFESVPPLKVNAISAAPHLSNTRPLLLLDEVPFSLALLEALPDLFPKGAILLISDVVVGREDFLRLPVGPLQREVAVRLLVNKGGLELDLQNRTTFNRICDLLEDIPLAIVITGNVMRERNVTLEATLQYLQEMSSTQKNGLDRAYTFAFGHLTSEEKNILSTAALTPGLSMSPDWLVAAAGSRGVEQLIERIKALGLLVTNSPRLSIPPGIRIQARRAATLDENTVLRRLTVFLIASLETNAQTWDFLSDELGNLYGALTWAMRTNNGNLALQLGRALDPYLTLHGLWDAWREVLDFLLQAARQTGNRAAEAFVLHQSGVREIGVGAHQQALDFLYQALRIRQALGDTVGMAYTQHNIDFLIGPPAPPGNNQPDPQPPAPITVGGMLPLLVTAFGFVAALGIVLLWILWPHATPPPAVPTSTLTAPPTDTLTSTPTVSPTSTPTLSPTSTSTPLLSVLTINLSYSALSDTAFLYQGVNSDYFEVPIAINLSNTSAVDTGAFDLSIGYNAYDGIHQAKFRFDDQSTYFDSQTLSGITAGKFTNREVRVMIPRIYEYSDVTLFVQHDRCPADVICMTNSLSYSLPQIVYDFIDNSLPDSWFGAEARLVPGLRLEDGFQPEYALSLRPPAGTAQVAGIYNLPDIQFAEGDRVFVKVGFLEGAGGNGATFGIDCTSRRGSNPVQVISFGSQGSNWKIVEVYDSYDQIVRGLNVQLPTELVSPSCNTFRMSVQKSSTSNYDMAVWISAYIARFRAGGVPPPPAMSTPQTPTITPTATSTFTPSITTPSATLTPFLY